MIAAVLLNGMFPTTLYGLVGSSTRRASPWMMETWRSRRNCSRNSPQRRESISTAMSSPHEPASGAVSAPRPGPISRTRSCGETRACATSLAASAPLRRKCCESHGRLGVRLYRADTTDHHPSRHTGLQKERRPQRAGPSTRRPNDRGRTADEPGQSAVTAVAYEATLSRRPQQRRGRLALSHLSASLQCSRTEQVTQRARSRDSYQENAAGRFLRRRRVHGIVDHLPIAAYFARVTAEPVRERVALVTGGNRGIGLEVCRGLAELGLTVALGSRDPAAGAEAAAELAR